VVVEVF